MTRGIEPKHASFDRGEGGRLKHKTQKKVKSTRKAERQGKNDFLRKKTDLREKNY